MGFLGLFEQGFFHRRRLGLRCENQYQVSDPEAAEIWNRRYVMSVRLEKETSDVQEAEPAA